MGIYKDEFFESILNKLNGNLDTDLFEKCVVDILRKSDFPTLVAIPGGQDSGMDGAISDGERKPIPLVVTTNKSPITNLEKNLSSYIRDGGDRRIAVFATSVPLTSRRINNLFSKAKELGFELIQIYEQESLAMRLYHEPSWCKNLLGLSGRPRALSKVPINSRSSLSDQVIGRDLEKKIILDKINNNEDFLVLGQPGIGKTYLLTEIANLTNTFFLNNDNIEQIYSDIRELRPDSIIIDDAHVKTELLKKIRLFRKENSVHFNLLCITWPSYKDKLLNLNELNDNNCIELQLFSRENIVKVIAACGINRPRSLIYHIVNQSVGKPGLASMLSKTLLTGGIDDFLSGNAIRRALLSSITDQLGNELEHLLAYLSFMGDKGASLNEVSNWSGIDLFKLNRLFSDMALLGIIKVSNDRKLIVIPEELRFVLVKNIFFNDNLTLDTNDFFNLALVESSIVEVLIGVKAKGGFVDDSQLFNLVKIHKTENILNMYASLGRKETLMLLQDDQTNLSKFYKVALIYAPQETVAIILNHIITQNSTDLNNLPVPSICILQDWVRETKSGNENVIRNKKILLLLVIKEFKDELSDLILFEILDSVFNPTWSTNESDPGSGMTITFMSGYYNEIEMKGLSDLWTLLFEKLQKLNHFNWKALVKILSQLVFPDLAQVKATDDFKKCCHLLAKKIIDDLYTISNSHAGVSLKLKNYCKALNHKKLISIDEDFLIIYPQETLRSDYRLQASKNLENVEKLSEINFSKPPASVLIRLEKLHKYAEDVGITWPDNSSSYVGFLASKVKNPKEWFIKGVELEILPKYLGPFFLRIIPNIDDKVEELIISLMDSKYYYSIGFLILLQESISERLVCETIKRLDKSYSDAIESLFYQNVPIETARKLLLHVCDEVREAAAIGEYLAGEEKKQVREELVEDWELAIVDAKVSKHWLGEIFEQNKDLAFKWLLKKINDGEYLSFNEIEIFNSATSIIEKKFTIQLITMLKFSHRAKDKLQMLVKEDIDCFKALLENKSLKELHLAPLEGMSGDNLNSFMVEAVRHGFSNEAIAHSIYSRDSGWYGNESSMLSAKLQLYNKALDYTTSEDAKNIVLMVITIFKKDMEKALKNEHFRDVYGRF